MIRLWRESTNDHTLAWNIPANVRRSYSQDTRQVQDAYDLPHVIRTRSNDRNVTGVEIRFPRGILADETGAPADPGADPPTESTLQTLKSYLTEAYRERHYMTVFDEDGAQYYAGTWPTSMKRSSVTSRSSTTYRGCSPSSWSLLRTELTTTGTT